MMSLNVSELPEEAAEELRRLLAEKAADLFKVCDQVTDRGGSARRNSHIATSALFFFNF